MLDDSVTTLAARVAITDLLIGYFSALDSRDFDGVGSCFAEDGVMSTAEGKSGVGPLAVAEFVRRAASHFRTSTHHAANIAITITDVGADAETAATATLVLNEPAGMLRVRGLHYSDQLRHDPNGWRIVRRVHRAVWMYDVPGRSL